LWVNFVFKKAFIMNQRSKSQTIGLDVIEPILDKLVSFDTTSHKSNLEIISYIHAYLQNLNVPCQLIPNETGDKSSLFASIGPAVPGGVGLSGHTDVVPVVGQNWHTDPFQLTRKGSVLYGRGTTDMKGFLAVILACVPLFKNSALKRPVHLIFSYDEEIGCTGVRPMIEKLGQDLPLPDFVMVGEPSNCQVVEAHKSILSFVTHVCGLEAHSSVRHRGVSAIEVAAKLITFLSHSQDELARVQHEPRFDPPFSTVHVGHVTGGTARNIVAKDCSFAWEVRALPDFDGAEIVNKMMAYAKTDLLPDMLALCDQCHIETEKLGSVPGLMASARAVELGLKLAQQNSSYAVSYGTEAGLFEIGGVPSVICGPGNINEAHKPNEFIEEEELMQCAQIMVRTAEYLET